MGDHVGRGERGLNFEEFLFDLMLWTFVHGRFVGLPREHPMPLPRVEFFAEDQMGPVLGYPNAPPMMGAYRLSDQTIFIPLHCGEKLTAACTAILVHEMVHHLVQLTTRPFSCKGKEERLAYVTSYKWLLDHAPEAMGTIALDPMTWMLATSCWEEQP